MCQAGTKQDIQLELGLDNVIAGYEPDVYIEREVDGQARAALERRRGVIIVGRPGSGKTHLAWQLLQERPQTLVVAPNPTSSRPPDKFEGSGLTGCQVLLLFNDLHKTAETMQPRLWRQRLEEAADKPCLLQCTTRDGEDWNTVNEAQELLLRELGADAVVYTSIVSSRGEIKGEDFSLEQGWELITARGLEGRWDELEATFNDTRVGITRFRRMKKRYKKLQKEERGACPMSGFNERWAAQPARA
jgi:hypothetical protein